MIIAIPIALAAYLGARIAGVLYDAVEFAFLLIAHRRRLRRVRLGRLAPILLALIAACSSAAAGPPPSTQLDAPTRDEQRSAPASAVTVRFSPNGGCTDEVVALIASARGSVRLAAYSFTSEPIAKALIAAHDHGRDVQVLVDHAWAGRPLIAKLLAAGVPVFTDAKHPIMHDKFVVIDSAVVETGSFNYTSQAEHGNAENCVTIRDASIARLFGANWLGHSAHSSGGRP